MADLSPLHRAALSRLVYQRDDRSWQRVDDVTSASIRHSVGSVSYSSREVLDLLRRMQQAGLVELAAPTRRGSYSRWRITDVGFAALGLPDGAQGVAGAGCHPISIGGAR